MAKVRLIATVSGKGGVGKTSVTVGTAFALAERGYRVGVMDLDLESSSLGDSLGISRDGLVLRDKIEPVMIDGVKVVSLALFPDKDWEDVPTLIDEDRVFRLVGQLFKAVNWGELDYLAVDTPPGTGPELRALIKQQVDGLILVAAAQRMSAMPVRKLVRMAREECHVQIVGIVSNDPYQFGNENTTGDILATMYGLPLLASIPWDAAIMQAMDDKRHPPVERFLPIADAIIKHFKQDEPDKGEAAAKPAAPAKPKRGRKKRAAAGAAT